jgi:ectoine hydroxylase-related dioxygenase (phytanoyl-CoA dioxygenase family)
MNDLNLLKNHYKEKGWVLYKDLFSSNKINIVKVIIDNFLKKQVEETEKKTRKINFIDEKNKDVGSINSFHELAKCDEIKSLANEKKILDIVEVFLSSKPEFRCCELFAKPAKIGLPSPDHQDNYYWGVKGSNALTVWIALDKSTKNNGCLHYYDGSHKFGILKHEASYAMGSSQKIYDKQFLKNFKVSYPELNPGDALIHHSLVVHGSSGNLSENNRKGWTIQFKDNLATYDDNQIKLYEQSLQKQIESRS